MINESQKNTDITYSRMNRNKQAFERKEDCFYLTIFNGNALFVSSNSSFNFDCTN